MIFVFKSGQKARVDFKHGNWVYILVSDTLGEGRHQVDGRR
jgi:hypothetical protein